MENKYLNVTMLKNALTPTIYNKVYKKIEVYRAACVLGFNPASTCSMEDLLTAMNAQILYARNQRKGLSEEITTLQAENSKLKRQNSDLKRRLHAGVGPSGANDGKSKTEEEE